MLALTAVTVPFLGEEFLPSFREYDFLMHWVEKPGTSIEAMQRITERASRELMAVPGVRNFGAHIGRAEVADEVVGPNFTELWISLDTSVDYEATVAHDPVDCRWVSGPLSRSADLPARAHQGSAHGRERDHRGPRLWSGPAGTAGAGSAVRAAITKVQGVADLTVQAQVLVPKVEVRFDPDRAAAFGLTPGEVRRVAATLVQGTKVGEFYEDQRLFDVVVWGTPEVRRNLDAIRALQVPIANGGMVPLGSVASVEVTPTPNEITRENGSRRIDVTSNVRGRDLGAVARDIQSQIATLRFPQGFYAEVLGEYAERQASSSRLTLLGIIAVAAIFLILLADFGSARVATLVFPTLPFALVGAIVAAFLTGGVLSLGSLVGLVTVIGISATERHHADQPLPASRTAGGHGVREGTDPARIRGAAGADSHDGARHRSGARADRAGRHARRIRDRTSARGGHPRRALYVDAAQPLHRAGLVSQVRTLRVDDSARDRVASRAIRSRTIVRDENSEYCTTPGRNEPCRCGSGRNTNTAVSRRTRRRPPLHAQKPQRKLPPMRPKMHLQRLRV